MIVIGVDLSLLQQNTIMKKYLILLVLSLTFLPGCESSAPSRFIYPSEKAMEVRYLCRLPYLDAKAPHQSWSKSTPAWLIINESKVIIFFEIITGLIFQSDFIFQNFHATNYRIID